MKKHNQYPKQNQQGFITLLILVVVVIGVMVGLAWWRVNGASAKKKAEETAKQKACTQLDNKVKNTAVTDTVCK